MENLQHDNNLFKFERKGIYVTQECEGVYQFAEAAHREENII